MDVKDVLETLETLGLSTEQIQERVDELRRADDSEEKIDKAFELVKWAIRVMGETSPQAFVQAANEMGLTTAEASSLAEVKKSRDDTAKGALGPLSEARATGQDLYEAFSAWRQTPACWRAIDKREVGSPIPGGTAFSHYINANLDPKVRAELIAKVEMYCKAGWADADLLDTHAPTTKAAKQLRTVVDRLQRGDPPVSPEQAAAAVSARFDELFMELKVVSLIDEKSKKKVFVATRCGAGQSGFDATGAKKVGGSVANSGFVDIAIKTHGEPYTLLVASVTKGNPFGTQADSFMRHATAILAAIDSGEIEGVIAAEFSRYANPTFYLEENTANEIDRAAAKGMDEKDKAAGNLVGAFADFDCPIDHPLADPEMFLRAPLHVFGAPDPLRDVQVQARAMAYSSPVAANALLVNTILGSARRVMTHLAQMGPDFATSPKTDEVGKMAVKTAIGVIRAFGDLRGIHAELSMLAEAVIKLSDACKGQGSVTFRELENLLPKVSAEAAKNLAQNNKPNKEDVVLARSLQKDLASRQRAALPVGIDQPAVSESRRLKAEYGRDVAELIRAMELSHPTAFPADTAQRLVETFIRYAQVSDATLPTRDAATGNNEKSYQRAADFLRDVKNGNLDIGSAGQMLVDKVLPWVKLNQGPIFDPTLNEPMSLNVIKDEIRDLTNKRKKQAKPPR